MNLNKYLLLSISLMMIVMVIGFYSWQSSNDPAKQVNRRLAKDIADWSKSKEEAATKDISGVRFNMVLDDAWIFSGYEDRLMNFEDSYLIDITYLFENKESGESKLGIERYYYDADTMIPLILRQDIFDGEHISSKYVWAGDFDAVCIKPEGSIF